VEGRGGGVDSKWREEGTEERERPIVCQRARARESASEREIVRATGRARKRAREWRKTRKRM
jgi:hypothetical protein